MAKIETLTKEQLQKAMACKTVDKLIKVAKTGGVERQRTRPRRIWQSCRTWSWTTKC